MDSVSMNHYEKQLYSVFKTFDVDNEEALDRPAVLQLCDALQLEDRGTALVDTLFKSQPERSRVSFTQFRNGLLTFLGAEAPSHPPSAALQSGSGATVTTPPHSDDDSSGREVAPKFTFGSKKYGRRSRPPRIDSDVSPRHRVASESRLDGERVKQRMKCKRSSSAMETRADSLLNDSLNLDHEERVDRDRALRLCQGLQMHSVDKRFIERVFEELKADEMSVGEFFDRLNLSLQTSIEASLDASGSDDIAAADIDVVPSDVIVEAWERAGVQKPRELLHELGFTVIALQLSDLEKALDEELQALGSSTSSEPHSLLLLAASTLSRLRVERFRQKLDMAIAERDKLRSDLSEANRRARLLAQDVDENHARIEAELKGRLRAVEAKHADASRAAAREAAAERERAARLQRDLEGEVARRADGETRLRADLAAYSQRNKELEERIYEIESRSGQVERECARLTGEANAAAEREAARAERECAARAELDACLLQLRADNQHLRDRADELAAALEAAARSAPVAPSVEPACWRDEADGPSKPQLDSSQGEERPTSDWNHTMQAMVSKLNGVSLEDVGCERCGASVCLPEADAVALKRELAEAKAAHEAERGNLNNAIKDLESSLEQLREEYERCEEYWAGKLREERDEQRASDERLAELAAKIAAYERQFASALPSVCESALEDQYVQLEAELQRLRRDKDDELARQMEELAKQNRRVEELERQLLQQRACTDLDVRRAQTRAGGGVGACWCGANGSGPAASALRARAARAERAAQRLHARLAAADLLVKDLYIENCRLAHLPHLPRLP